MASSSYRGGDFYGAGGIRSREGLSTRQVGGSDEIQLRIDPIHGGLDDEISGFESKFVSSGIYIARSAMILIILAVLVVVGGLVLGVAQEIETEAKFQNDFINQLQMTLIKAQAGVKNNMRRLNRSIVKEGANHIVHVVLFALVLFFVVYFLAKFR